jgi:hypothetical protein
MSIPSPVQQHHFHVILIWWHSPFKCLLLVPLQILHLKKEYGIYQQGILPNTVGIFFFLNPNKFIVKFPEHRLEAKYVSLNF